jgi:ChpA-C
MRNWTVRAARAVLVGAAFAAVGAGIAHADTDNNTTSGNRSLLGGLLADVKAPISAPNLLAGNTVDASGNNLQVLSPRSVASSGGSTGRLRYVYHHSRNIEATSVGSGDQLSAPVSAPILICGNAVSNAGLGTAACRGRSSIASGVTASQAGGACPAACAPAVQVPAAPAKPAIPACAATCAPVEAPAQPAAPACATACAPVGAQACPSACSQSTAQNGSSATQLLSNDQVRVPIAAPITICGNAGAVRGLAAAACEGDASFSRGNTF